MLDLNTLVDAFCLNGYLLLENFFDPEVMDQCHELILNHFGDDPAFFHNDEFLSKASTEVIPWFPGREGVAAFNDLEDHEALTTLTDALLGSGWTSQYSMVMFSKQGTKGQAWHQDCPPDDAHIYNVNRLAYTSDITPANGGQTVVVPGSHLRGLLPVGDPHEDFEDQVVLSPSKGSLIILHGHTWHRVLPVKGSYRVSTNFRCGPMGTPDDITDTCVYRNMRYQFSRNQVVEARV